MSKDYDFNKFYKTAMWAGGNVLGESAKKHFNEAEFARLDDECLKLQFGALWISFLMLAIFDPSKDFCRDDWPDLEEIDEILTDFFVATFKIGSATYAHPAVERYLDDLGASKARAGRKLTFEARKKDEVKKNVLPQLIAQGLSRAALHNALNKALVAKGLKEGISIETAARWKRDHLKAHQK